jgi:hypothetical protein
MDEIPCLLVEENIMSLKQLILQLVVMVTTDFGNE